MDTVPKLEIEQLIMNALRAGIRGLRVEGWRARFSWPGGN